MKNKLLVIALIVGTVLYSKAQDKGTIELGVGIGLNSASVASSNGIDGSPISTTSLTSFNMGISGEYYFSDSWGLKLKLAYDGKGWAKGIYTNYATGNSVETNYKLNYLTLPITANWHFGANKNWYLSIGSYLGILLNAKDSELGLDLKSGFKNTDYGFAFGGGYRYKLTDKIKLYLEYDGQLGFSEIFELPVGNITTNNRHAFNIGCVFRW